MFEIFIRRPILSGVISVVIVFLGLLAINSLPITQFPDIVPPSVTVTARYTGANADVMAKTVATPLERAINGVPGMTYMTSVCTNDGMSLTTIYFKVGTDPDVASVNVQNRVTTVLDELPEEVIRAGVITEKEVNSMLMYLNIMSSDSTHTEKFVYNFADIRERGLGSPAIHFRDSGFHLCIYSSGRWKGERTQLRAVGSPRFLLRDTGFAGPDRYRLRGCSDDHGRHDYQSRYGRWSHDPSSIGIV